MELELGIKGRKWMLNFKVALLNFLFKFEVVSDLPGRMRLKVKNFKKIPKEAVEYQKYGVQAIKKLKGVRNVTFNFVIGTILIEYDNDILDSKKIVHWLNIIKNLLVQNIDLINSLEGKSEEEASRILFAVLDEHIKN